MNSSKFITSRLSIPQLQSGQQGISLIDSLIALVIFSVGLLAIAALQTVSKRSNYEAMQRTNATMYAYDLVERMRMNSDALTSYVSDSILTGSPAQCATASDITTCTSVTEVAANDLYEWKATVLGEKEKNSANVSVGGLIDPVACLTRVGTTNEFTLAIAWRGQTSISNQSASTCGNGTVSYNDPVSGDQYGYRRILVLNTYIGN
jgi:type IV pilus assembly protein PilV